MDYLGYLAIIVLVSGGIFFALAIYHFSYAKDLVMATRFTAYGFFVLAVCSLVLFWVPSSVDYRVSGFSYIVFSAIYYWLSRNIRKEKD